MYTGYAIAVEDFEDVLTAFGFFAGGYGVFEVVAEGVYCLD